MKLSLLYIVLQYLFLCSIGSSQVLTTQDADDRDLSFGTEFTLDHVISSVTLANGSTYGLAKVPGGEAYQSLMRHYLELCHNVYLTQDPPLEEMQESLRKAVVVEQNRREQLIRQPETSWWDFLAIGVFRRPEYSPAVFEGDEFAGDADAEVLTHAVEASKTASMQVLNDQFSIKDPFPRPYATIVAPDFFWTTIKPKPHPELQPDGMVSWNDNFDTDSVWFHLILRKLSVALYRNKFRGDELSNWREILSGATSVSKTTPASFQTLSHTRKHHCVTPGKEDNSTVPLCGPKTLSGTSIVVGFNNASLALWLEGSKSDWTPWNTFPELGGHVLASDEGHESIAHWDQVVAKMDMLSENIDSPSKAAVDVILSGESWDEQSLTTFQERIREAEGKRQIEMKNIVYQPDVFAASKRSARWGRYDLDFGIMCYQQVDKNGEPDHDEL